MGGALTAVCGAYTNTAQESTSKETAVCVSEAGGNISGQGQVWPDRALALASARRTVSWQGVVVEVVGTAVSAARSQAGLSINMTGRPKITTTKITVTHRHMGMIVTSRQATP